LDGEVMGELSGEVRLWWTLMSLMATINIGLWVWVMLGVVKAEKERACDLKRYWRWQALMSGVFVLVCAFRSYVLRSDVTRHCLIDSWVASVVVGRTAATIAEICFVVQWAMLLSMMARLSGVNLAKRLAWALVPIICVAECASWFAVLTTNRMGNVIEESLWAMTAALFVAGLCLCHSKVEAHLRGCIKTGVALGLGYVLYMVTVDVPTYFALWQSAETQQVVYLSWSEGWADIQRCIVTGQFEDWRYAMVWMSLYFSVGVWISLAMVVWPRLGNRLRD